MLYTRNDGSVTPLPNNEDVISEVAIMKLIDATKMIDDYYEHLNTKQHGQLRAIVGRLNAMVEE